MISSFTVQEGLWWNRPFRISCMLASVSAPCHPPQWLGWWVWSCVTNKTTHTSAVSWGSRYHDNHQHRSVSIIFNTTIVHNNITCITIDAFITIPINNVVILAIVPLSNIIIASVIITITMNNLWITSSTLRIQQQLLRPAYPTTVASSVAPGFAIAFMPG